MTNGSSEKEETPPINTTKTVGISKRKQSERNHSSRHNCFRKKGIILHVKQRLEHAVIVAKRAI